MQFRTELIPQESSHKISHSDKILCVGSCFAESVGKRFFDFQFDIETNPFGILYNPLSIFDNLTNCLSANPVDTTQVIESRGLHFHYQFHSDIFGTTNQELVTKIEDINSSIHKRLKETKYLFITLGTAFVYTHKKTGISVANCHKMPSESFDKKMLSVEDIIRSFSDFYPNLILQQPDIKIVLTVSPVRHIKDTLELNSVSKSVLRLACHYITNANPAKVAYFPSYEIIMDDLRDYRFYKEDLIHPTLVAEEYVWAKLGEVYFSDQTNKLNSDIAKIMSALAHRPFHPHSEEHFHFLKKTQNEIEQLNNKIPMPRLLEKMALKLSEYR